MLEAEWEFEVKPLNKAEVHFFEKGISHLKTGVHKKAISQLIKQGSNGVYEYCYELAPECQYSAENHGMVATHIFHAHMGICVGCQYCPKKAWSGHTWGTTLKLIIQVLP